MYGDLSCPYYLFCITLSSLFKKKESRRKRSSEISFTGCAGTSQVSTIFFSRPYILLFVYLKIIVGGGCNFSFGDHSTEMGALTAD